jgi:acetyl esterase/lipase
MTFTLDPELAEALAPFATELPAPDEFIGDWKTIRANVAIGQAALGALVPSFPDVAQSTFTAKTADGRDVALRWFAPTERSTRAAVVHAHGGGMVAASVDLFAPYISQYVALSGVPFLSVEYRLAPEGRNTDLAEDVFAGLNWLAQHSDELEIDPRRIGLFGESAGAGIAAGVAILARERGIPVARQILIYPMLDDRTVTPDPQLEGLANWTYASNETGWTALLGDDRGATSVSPVAAPARLTDFAGLPETYIEVGALDIFRDEDVRFALNLLTAGVPTELHVHPGLLHGFDQFGNGCFGEAPPLE